MPGQTPGSGRKILLKIARVPAQAWIVLVVAVLLGARPVWAFVHRPVHLNETIAECGAYNLFRKNMMASDRAGDRLAYVQSTKSGMGIFLYDGGTGQRQLMAETMTELAGQPFIGTPHLVSWLPDDKSFASFDMELYAAQEGNVDIFDAISRKMETIPCGAGRFIPERATPFGSWLTPDCLVYRTAAREIRRLQKQADGQWEDGALYVPTEGKGDLGLFTATSSQSIVWQQETVLWKLDVNSNNAATRIFQAPAKNPDFTQITAVSYSPETDQYLLSCRGKKRDSLWRATPGDSSAENAQLITSGTHIEAAQWINGGGGYAYLGRSEDNRPVVVVQRDASARPVSLFAKGDASAFTVSANGKRLFIVGVMSNEFAPAIWKYDIDPASLQCIAPGLDRPWQFGQRVKGIYKTFTSSSGKNHTIELFLPPDFNFQQHRRYPLMITSDYTAPYGDALANCNIVCAHVPVYDTTEEKWENAVVETCQYLVANRVADPKRIFAAVSSAETRMMFGFSGRHPDLWKGIILLSPTDLPDLPTLASNRHVPKILISAGMADPMQENGRRPTQYQAEAAKLGIRVDVIMREGAWHEFMSDGARSGRLQAMADFVYED